MAICPLCNHLEDLTKICPVCGQVLQDGGPLENYFGPYSPYMERESIDMAPVEADCIHVLYCPECYYEIHEPRKRINI